MPHLDAAYRFARWLSHSSDEAQDIVQEAFLRAFRSFDALRSADAKAWLLTIVRNCHATARQQEQRRGFVPLPEEPDAQFGAETLAAAPLAIPRRSPLAIECYYLFQLKRSWLLPSSPFRVCGSCARSRLRRRCPRSPRAQPPSAAPSRYLSPPGVR